MQTAAATAAVTFWLLPHPPLPDRLGSAWTGPPCMPLRVPARKQLSTPVSCLTHSLLLLPLLLQRTCGQIQGGSLAWVSMLSAPVTDAGPPLCGPGNRGKGPEAFCLTYQLCFFFFFFFKTNTFWLNLSIFLNLLFYIGVSQINNVLVSSA